MSGIFYAGQEVGCIYLGKTGKTHKVLTEGGLKYPVQVEFEGGAKAVYTSDGRYQIECRPTLYPIEQYREIMANLPEPQPEPVSIKPGMLCWFFDNNLHRYGVAFRRFSEIKDDQYVDEHGIRWQRCEPYEPGKLPSWMEEVQP